MGETPQEQQTASEQAAFDTHANQDSALTEPDTEISPSARLTSWERIAIFFGIPPTLTGIVVFICVPTLIGIYALHSKAWRGVYDTADYELNLDKDFVFPVLFAVVSIYIGFHAGTFATRFNDVFIRIIEKGKRVRPKGVVPKPNILEEDKAKKEE